MATPVAAGTVEKTTGFKEYIAPGSEQQPRKNQKRPPLWEWLPTVSQEDFKDLQVEIALYRYPPVTEKRQAVEKYFEYIDPFIILKKHGGGKFNIYVKYDGQLLYNDDFEIEGPPIIAGTNGSPATNGTGAAPPATGSDAVALQAMHMMSNPEMMRGMFTMYAEAAKHSMEMIRAQMPAPVDALATLRNAKEILGVGANPDGGFLQTITLLKELGLLGSPEKQGVKEILEIINTLKGSGLIGTAAKPDLGSSFVAALPAIADRMVQGLHEYRITAEANERTIRLQRGEMKPGDPNVITMDGPRTPNPAPADSAAPAAAEPSPAAQAITPEVAGQIIMQHNLHRLVAGIKQPDSTGEDMYDFLVNAWPEILPELTKISKDHLLMLFRTPQIQQEKLGNTILMEVASEPRLPKIIEEFLACARKAEAEKRSD